MDRFSFSPGFDIYPRYTPMGFVYGENAFGPVPEIRRLDDIRRSLKNPRAQGPEELYCIAMDVGDRSWKAETSKRDLLFGAVIYNAGTIGQEPVRSQGHIHGVSPSCGASTCEVYEIWEGTAAVYMQERAEADPGRCYGVVAHPGEVVVVPPGWVHATVNMDIHKPMAFGAWCIRDYGFEYNFLRAMQGIAFYPLSKDGIEWEMNPNYRNAKLLVKAPGSYEALGLRRGIPIYRQFRENPDVFRFVSRPGEYQHIWESFEP